MSVPRQRPRMESIAAYCVRRRKSLCSRRSRDIPGALRYGWRSVPRPEPLSQPQGAGVYGGRLSWAPRSSWPRRSPRRGTSRGRSASSPRGSPTALRGRSCSASPGRGRRTRWPPSSPPSTGPRSVIAPNKTLAAQLYSEFKSLFPENAVEYFVSYYDYYQPEAYVPHSDTYIEKDSAINEQIDKMRHSATRSVMTRRRRDRDRLRVVHLRPRVPGVLRGDDRARRGGRGVPPQRAPAAADRPAVRAQRRGLPPRDVPRPRRRGGAVPRLRGREGPADRVRRGPDRPDPPRGPPPGDAAERGAGNGHLPGQPLRDAGGSARAGGPRDRGGARSTARGAPRAGKAARGGAPEAADHLRPRDDLPDGILLRHRELLPPSRRARPRPAAAHAPRLLPEGVRHLPRRVPRDRSPAERDVQRRPVPEADAGGFRVPAPLRARQPAAPVRGVQRAGWGR